MKKFSLVLFLISTSIFAAEPECGKVTSIHFAPNGMDFTINSNGNKHFVPAGNWLTGPLLTVMTSNTVICFDEATSVFTVQPAKLF